MKSFHIVDFGLSPHEYVFGSFPKGLKLIQVGQKLYTSSKFPQTPHIG